MPKLMYDDKNYSGNASSSGGGVFPHLIVISETGSTVTATKGSTTITARETSTDHFECDLVTPNPQDIYGTWLIHAILNGDDAQASLVVDAVKVYTVDDEHFHADIIVTYPDGSVVSCTKDGLSPMYATSSPYTFTVHSIGMYTITGERDGTTEIVEVDIISNGQTENVTLDLLPDGETVTPTDNIQILLHCAGIDNKSYTTISELLADDTTLLKVLTHNNAIDYLVRSTTFASAITADADAMAMIGSYDYASDTLLADSTWATAIANSTYVTSVANVSVPTMTSNTTPSGVASASGEYSNFSSYKAFDKINANPNWWVDTNSVASGATSPEGWLQYKFPSAVKVYFAHLKQASNAIPIQTWSIKGSNDGSNFTSLASGTTLADDTNAVLSLTNRDNYLYYRMYLTQKNTASNTSHLPNINEINFYGRENGGVQSLLRAGGITDKSYTTLAELLADTTTLSALIANHDAVDYLVTAKAFIDGIVADATAMSYIGLNNYCANTLLADAEWCDGICNSTYKESVLNVKVPTMTSATTPSGEVFASSYASSYYPWYVFGNKTAEAQCWATTGNQTGVGYIGYNFGRAVKIVAVMWRNRNSTQANRPLQVGTIQGSNDGTTWVDIADVTTQSLTYNTVTNGAFGNNSTYSRYRLFVKTPSDTAGLNMQALQFYGREDV